MRVLYSREMILLNMTPPLIEFIQKHNNVESDFHITEQMDEFRSVTRGGRLIKPAQKYQGIEWMTVRGKGNEVVEVEVPDHSPKNPS
ncbi:hypothetical protein Bca4012_054775 [Brassica carinata]